MTAQLVMLLPIGIALVPFAAWAVWPRKRPGASAENNRRQRDGTEIESTKTDANGGTIDPAAVAVIMDTYL